MRGRVIQQLRLWSGVVLFAYVTGHLLNHTFGLASVEAMEAGRRVFSAVWRSPPGTVLLVGSFAVHGALSIARLFRKRDLRMPIWEAAQQLLGLAIPFLLCLHMLGTLGLSLQFGMDPSYPFVLWATWSDPLQQIALMAAAWTHGCIGMHFWLRLQPWYRRGLPLFFAAALLLPALALAGFAVGGRDVLAMAAADSGWVGAMLEQIRFPGRAGVEWVQGIEARMSAMTGMAIAALIAWRLVRALRARRQRPVRVTYPDGRMVRAEPGATLLEVSRAAGIPHASVCGGRGRCSTCRVHVSHGFDTLPPADEGERALLTRIGAPARVRLACRTVPAGDVTLTPLLPATAGPVEARARTSSQQGAEREIAILFADLRAFTKLSEDKLPYDVVFLLNRYFLAMGRAVEEAGGHVDKFIGDGVMALFGIDGEPREGCRSALEAVRAMAAALGDLNAALGEELAEPLRIGVGLHAGPVIVGEMGYSRATSVTAIGDAVNVASRLEPMTKEFACQAVISQRVVRLAGADFSAIPSRLVEIRGRERPLRVYPVADGGDIPPPA